MIDNVLETKTMELTDEQLEAVSGGHWGGQQPSWYSGGFPSGFGSFGGYPTTPSNTTTHTSNSSNSFYAPQTVVNLGGGGNTIVGSSAYQLSIATAS